MATCPTVKVVHEDGYMVINESDFDPKKHKPFKASAKKAKKEA